MIAGWRRNLRKDIPNPPAGNRTGVLTTDDAIQTGPAPRRINRLLSENVSGYSGPRQQGAFPATQDDAYVIHLGVKKLVNPTLRYRTYGDNAYIPGVYAGNPIR